MAVIIGCNIFVVPLRAPFWGMLGIFPLDFGSDRFPTWEPGSVLQGAKEADQAGWLDQAVWKGAEVLGQARASLVGEAPSDPEIGEVPSTLGCFVSFIGGILMETFFGFFPFQVSSS